MKIKLIASSIMLTLLCLLGSCDDKLEVQQAYDFSLTSWYLQKTISPDETVEVYDKKNIRLVNREMQPLDSIAELEGGDPCRQVFTLFYRNRSSKNAEIKFVAVDNFGQERDLDISFATETENEQ